VQEDEEDEEEGGGRRKKSRAAQFFDDIAAVDDDEEEDEADVSRSRVATAWGLETCLAECDTRAIRGGGGGRQSGSEWTGGKLASRGWH
jgi:hypothetical protein